MAEKMDRGSDAMKAHFDGVKEIEIRQTRRGWCQECFGCEAKTEFKWFKGEEQFAHSLEDSSCCCRFWCAPSHNFTMVAKELNTEAELLTVDRPCRCPIGSCKCCCYQSAKIMSGGNDLGEVKETCWFCVPQFNIFDHEEKQIYILHQPTCCCGTCVYCCAEGNPCSRKGCCKVSFRLYSPDQKGETGKDAEYLGMIMKKPKSFAVEVFTDSDAFEVKFPDAASNDEKAIVAGSALFLNAVFFEGEDGAAA